MSVVPANKIQLRRDTLQNWITVNPILASGEAVCVFNTTSGIPIGMKFGDGTHHFLDLPWVAGSGPDPSIPYYTKEETAQAIGEAVETARETAISHTDVEILDLKGQINILGQESQSAIDSAAVAYTLATSFEDQIQDIATASEAADTKATSALSVLSEVEPQVSELMTDVSALTNSVGEIEQQLTTLVGVAVSVEAFGNDLTLLKTFSVINNEIIFSVQDISTGTLTQKSFSSILSNSVLQTLGIARSTDIYNLNATLASIQSAIPVGATSANKLVTITEVNTMLDSLRGRELSKTPAGAPFMSASELFAGPWYFGDTPIISSSLLLRNDTAVVSGDSNYLGRTTRYIYTGAVWKYAFTITPFQLTDVQHLAINSGITAEILASLRNTDTALLGTINGEINRATIRENNIARTAADETTRAEQSEGILDAKIDTTRVILQGNINAESVRAEGAEEALEDRITTEENRARLEELRLDTAINTNLQASVILGGELHARLTSEVSRATGIEANLQEQVNTKLPATFGAGENGLLGLNSSNAVIETDVPEDGKQYARIKGEFVPVRVQADDAWKVLTDASIDNLETEVSAIENKIPLGANAENKLVDEFRLLEAVGESAGRVLSYSINGDAFPLLSDLTSATIFYYGGEEVEPINRDIAVVLDSGDGSTVKYVYQEGTWSISAILSATSLTQVQQNALNSGVSAEWKTDVDAKTSADVISVSMIISEMGTGYVIRDSISVLVGENTYTGVVLAVDGTGGLLAITLTEVLDETISGTYDIEGGSGTNAKITFSSQETFFALSTVYAQLQHKVLENLLRTEEDIYIESQRAKGVEGNLQDLDLEIGQEATSLVEAINLERARASEAESELSATFNTLATAVGAVNTNVGLLSLLNTAEKTNLVLAINELDARLDAIVLRSSNVSYENEGLENVSSVDEALDILVEDLLAQRGDITTLQSEAVSLRNTFINTWKYTNDFISPTLGKEYTNVYFADLIALNGQEEITAGEKIVDSNGVIASVISISGIEGSEVVTCVISYIPQTYSLREKVGGTYFTAISTLEDDVVIRHSNVRESKLSFNAFSPELYSGVVADGPKVSLALFLPGDTYTNSEGETITVNEAGVYFSSVSNATGYCEYKKLASIADITDLNVGDIRTAITNLQNVDTTKITRASEYRHVISEIVSAGNGYVVGDLITVNVIKGIVTSVNANGGITDIYFYTTQAAASPDYTLISGGSGSGAEVKIGSSLAYSNVLEAKDYLIRILEALDSRKISRGLADNLLKIVYNKELVPINEPAGIVYVDMAYSGTSITGNILLPYKAILNALGEQDADDSTLIYISKGTYTEDLNIAAVTNKSFYGIGSKDTSIKSISITDTSSNLQFENLKVATTATISGTGNHVFNGVQFVGEVSLSTSGNVIFTDCVFDSAVTISNGTVSFVNCALISNLTLIGTPILNVVSGSIQGTLTVPTGATYSLGQARIGTKVISGGAIRTENDGLASDQVFVGERGVGGYITEEEHLQGHLDAISDKLLDISSVVSISPTIKVTDDEIISYELTADISHSGLFAYGVDSDMEILVKSIVDTSSGKAVWNISSVEGVTGIALSSTEQNVADTLIAGNNINYFSLYPLVKSLSEDAQDLAGEISSLTDIVEGNSSNITAIGAKIPSAATSGNKLADKAYVDSKVQSMAARYITSTADGAQFLSLADLQGAATYYYSGTSTTLETNDYAVFLAVEDDITGQSVGTQCRAQYSGTVWQYQYALAVTFTEPQEAALNSGITSDDKVLMSSATDGSTANTLVKRDANNNFSAGTITANLIGTATKATSAESATRLGTEGTAAASNKLVLGNGKAPETVGDTDKPIYIKDGEPKAITTVASATTATTATTATRLLYENLSSSSATPKNLNNYSLSADTTSPYKKYYICKIDGDSEYILNRPSSSNLAFNLEVELVRAASSTDYITKQTYTEGATKKIWSRYCVHNNSNITWSDWVLESTDGVATKATKADTATKLATAKTINGVPFDGSKNITITANPTSEVGTENQILYSGGSSSAPTWKLPTFMGKTTGTFSSNDVPGTSTLVSNTTYVAEVKEGSVPNATRNNWNFNGISGIRENIQLTDHLTDNSDEVPIEVPIGLTFVSEVESGTEFHRCDFRLFVPSATTTPLNVKIYNSKIKFHNKVFNLADPVVYAENSHLDFSTGYTDGEGPTAVVSGKNTEIHLRGKYNCTIDCDNEENDNLTIYLYNTATVNLTSEAEGNSNCNITIYKCKGSTGNNINGKAASSRRITIIDKSSDFSIRNLKIEAAPINDLDVTNKMYVDSVGFARVYREATEIPGITEYPVAIGVVLKAMKEQNLFNTMLVVGLSSAHEDKITGLPIFGSLIQTYGMLVVQVPGTDAQRMRVEYSREIGTGNVVKWIGGINRTDPNNWTVMWKQIIDDSSAQTIMGKKTFQNAEGVTISNSASTADKLIIKANNAAGTTKTLTLQNAALTADRVITLPDISGTVVVKDANNNFSAGTITANLDGNAKTAGIATSATNLLSGSLGNVPYQTASGATGFITNNTTTTKQFLSQTAGAKPVWGTLTSADIPNLAPSKITFSAIARLGDATNLEAALNYIAGVFAGTNTVNKIKAKEFDTN